MSATPESFLDTMDADVPDNAFDSVSGGENEPSAEDSGRGSDSAGPLSSTEKGGEGSPGKQSASNDGSGRADAVKDKVDPAKPDDKAEKVVPLKALQEEREQAKELKRQIAELQAQPKLTAEDSELLKELKAQKAAKEPLKEVDFMEDPKGYIDAGVKKALDKLEAIDKKAETVQTTVTQEQQYRALMGAIVAHEQAFTAENPDYLAALTHVRAVRTTQMRLMAPTATDEQISAALNQEELQTAHQLLARGQNPCKFAYDYAKTLGYTKKEAPKANGIDKADEVDKSAVRTMGAGGGDAPSDDAIEDDDPNAEFLAAKAAFGRRR